MSDKRKVSATKSEVAVFLVELPCQEEDCAGTLQKVEGDFIGGNGYPHMCLDCTKEVWLTRRYPHLEYDKLPVPPQTHETEQEEI